MAMTQPSAELPAVSARPWVATGRFVRALLASRSHATRVLALTMLLALTEWIGLFMLVPMLAVVGLSDTSGPAGRMVSSATGALAALGIRITLPAMLLLFVALVAVRAVVQRLETGATSALENHFVLSLRMRCYTAMMRARWSFIAGERGSDFAHVLTLETTRVGSAAYQVLRLLVHVVLTGVYLLLAVRLSIPMTLLAGATGIVLLVSLRRRNTEALAAGDHVSTAGAELHAVVQEHIDGLKTARCYGAEDRNAVAFATHAHDLAAASNRVEVNQATASALLSVGSAALLGAFVYVAVALVALPTTAVLLLLLIFSRIIPRIADAQNSLQQFLVALPAYNRVIGLIETSEAAGDVHTPAALASHAASPAIRVSDVSLRYPGATQPALRGVSFDVPSHQFVAIVGASGAGKSTIADLLLGILTPDSGAVEIDGQVLGPAIHRSWRERIGFVPQDTFLLHDTVRANLRWAVPDASETDLRDALAAAAALEFVERLPQGLDTKIGDRGVLLSGGERQRLALARALLRKPGVLILDEATSALDSENEQRIQDAIARVHGTISIVMITHRLSAIRDADRIVVLDGGQVVQSGSWSELQAEKGGRFWSLCLAQRIVDPQEPAW